MSAAHNATERAIIAYLRSRARLQRDARNRLPWWRIGRRRRLSTMSASYESAAHFIGAGAYVDGDA